MPAENWAGVRRLLVLQTQAVSEFEELLLMVQRSLPQAEIMQKTAAKEFSSLDVQWLSDRRFDAALIFTAPNQSPYALAYLCYLAGIPIRVGQSQEFGGSVLSACIAPPLDRVSSEDYYLHLINTAFM
jgi:hypothetical protein